jgi:hypothetical protein
MPVEWSGQDDTREDPLTLLGGVPEPGPGVLDAARERLWPLVAAEMQALEVAGEMLVLDADQMDRDVAGRDPESLPDQGRYHLRASAERSAQLRRHANGDSQ